MFLIETKRSTKSKVSAILMSAVAVILAVTIVLPVVQLSFLGSKDFLTLTTGSISLTPDLTFPELVQQGIDASVRSEAQLALQITFFIAFVAVIASIGLYFLNKARSGIVAGIIAVIAQVALFTQYYLFGTKDGQVIPLSETFSLTLQVGFGIALWMLLAASILMAISLVLKVKWQGSSS